MAGNEIDISNIISVTLSATPITMKQANLSAVALFTTEDGTGDDYTLYKTSTAVAEDYGTDSEVYKQAVRIFAQAPNILSANGYLLVFPMLKNVTIAATPGYALCESVNLQNFRYVTDGSINFNVDGAGARALTGLNFTAANTTQKLCAIFNDAFAAQAKGATITTPVIDPADFIAVDNGSLTIQTGIESAVEVTGIDFTSDTTLSDIATSIQGALTTAEVPVAVTADTTNGVLVFTTVATGADTSINIAAGNTGTDITGSSYLNIAGATSADGADAIGCTASIEDGRLKFTSNTTGASSSVEITGNDTGTDLSAISYLDTNTIDEVQGKAAYSGRERLVDAIIRAQTYIYFNGILVDHPFDDDTELLDASDYVQTQSQMLFVGKHELNCCESGMVFDRIRSRHNTHTRCIAHFIDDSNDITASPVNAQTAREVAAAYAGRGLSVDFSASNACLTMQVKDLTGIEPSPAATQTLVDKAKRVGADCYVSLAGVPCELTSGANDFFDNVYNDLWLKTALQVAGFNLLHTTASKIPQTAAGLETLISAFADVLKLGVKNGSFAPGSWTRADTFGDPIRLKQGILSLGWYIYADPITEQPQADREERKAPPIQIAAKRSGAFHSVNIMVYIND